MTLVAGSFLIVGVAFLFIGAVGLVRLPDFYSRLHATGKCDTFGMTLCLIGLALYGGFTVTSLKILIVGAFILVGNPTATHAISRAAYRSGLRPWTRNRGGDA
ncbi:MAG: monovalent cation/H(+) antiporter subunit G [Bacillota bacterium]|jgi:multicomponent Na+:H+ antiporter subunit G